MKFDKAKRQIKTWAKQASHQKQGLESQKKYLQDKLQKNPNVGEAVKKHSCETLFFQYLYSARHSQKKFLNNNCVRFNGKQAPNKKRITVKTEAKFRKDLKQSIMDDYDCGGKKIGDLTRREVYEEARRLRAQGEGSIQQANIFMAIYKKMSGKKTVRECITSITLINIVNKFKVVSKIA